MAKRPTRGAQISRTVDSRLLLGHQTGRNRLVQLSKATASRTCSKVRTNGSISPNWIVDLLGQTFALVIRLQKTTANCALASLSGMLHSFSGLIKCASCDSGMSPVSRIYYACSSRRNKGTCDNHLTVRLDRPEEAGLRGLQDRLLAPELTKEFAREYTIEINRLKVEATAHQQGSRNKLRNLSESIDNIVDAIAVGKTSKALLKRLNQLEGEKELLKHSMAVSAPDPVRIHPNAASIYITKVNNLRDALNVDDTRAEAFQILRALVDEIRLHPIDRVLQIELVGDLAKLLGFASAHPTQKRGFIGNLGSTEWLVAGTRSPLFRTQVSTYLPIK